MGDVVGLVVVAIERDCDVLATPQLVQRILEHMSSDSAAIPEVHIEFKVISYGVD